MILAVVRASWLALSRDRAALALTFAVPIVFFSIFAGVCGSQGRNAMEPAGGTRGHALCRVGRTRGRLAAKLHRPGQGSSARFDAQTQPLEAAH